MHRPRAPLIARGLAALAALAAPPSVRADDALAARLTGPDGMTLFTEDAIGPVQVAITGPDGAVAVQWRAEERLGDWRDAGRVDGAIAGGAARLDLPLHLPGRGLFTLSVDVTAGGMTTHAQGDAGVAFAPRPDPRAPWGVFVVPARWYGPDEPAAWESNAENLRRLGASWARLCFWPDAFADVHVDRAAGTASAEFPRWLPYARALHARRISILGNLGGVPVRELSSCPTDDRVDTSWDGGPFWQIAKPGDWRTWDDLVQRTAAAFAGVVQVWELYNEPNMRDWYWRGTPEELVEAVAHGAAAIRRGDPAARVAGCGIVGRGQDGIGYADRLLELGIGQHLDILSCHYTDEDPTWIGRWRDIAAKHAFTGPLWCSEETPAVALANVMGGLGVTIKFLHVAFNDRYAASGSLARKDLSPTEEGIAFSVAAHEIGAAQPIDERRAPGVRLRRLRRPDGMVAVLEADPAAPTVAATLTVAGDAAMATDRLGRSRRLMSAGGRVVVPAMPAPVFVTAVTVDVTP